MGTMRVRVGGKMHELARTTFIVLGGLTGVFFFAALLTDVRDLLAARRMKRGRRI